MSANEFGICFELGRALRRGDVEAFFNVYDKLIPQNAQIEGVKETARLISELSWSEYSLVEDAFGDPNTAVAKRSINFHNPLPVQLEKIMHEIRGGVYYEDSGTLSDMDSLSSETDVKVTKEEKYDGESCQISEDFSIEVGGFAIRCESDDKMNGKKNDYMYEIGTNHVEVSSELKLVETGTNGKDVEDEIKETGDIQETAPLLPPTLPTQPTARPRSAPTFSSLQQRRSSHIQLKSFSTTSLLSHQPTATTSQEKSLIMDYKSVSMNDQFPKWLYSEVVKVGLQYSKPSFFRTCSSSSLSSSCSDPESAMDEEGTATDSSNDQHLMQTGTTNGDASSSSCTSLTQDNAREAVEQFNHYEAICYLWREWKDTLKNC